MRNLSCLYFAVLTFFIASLFVNNLNAQDCCSFDIRPFLRGPDVPTPDMIENCKNSSSDCDVRFLLAAQLIHKIDSGEYVSAYTLFEEIVPLVETLHSKDTISIRLIGLYANFLERAGKSNLALYLYKFLIENTDIGSFDRKYALACHANIELNSNKIHSLYNRALEDKSYLSSLLPKEQAELLIKQATYLDKEDQFKLFQLVPDSIINLMPAYHRLAFLFDSSVPFYRDYNSPEFKYYWNKIEDANKEVQAKSEFKITWYSLNAIKANNEHNYKSALDNSIYAMEHLANTKFKDVDEFLTILKDLKDYKNAAILAYAHSLLYQTRLGADIKTVEDAFKIYEYTSVRELLEVVRTGNKTVGNKTSRWRAQQMNLLIVGNYLYNKTGEIDYLNRSLSVLEGYSGAGLNYWAATRAQMRNDPELVEAKAAETAAYAALTDIGEEETLSQLMAKINVLAACQQRLNDDFPELNEAIRDSREIDLRAIQQKLAVDSAGIMAFYIRENNFYRLYLTPDTVEVSILSRDLAEIGELAEKFHQQAAQKEPPSTFPATSSRLYRLLFRGHEYDLPQRLHIVADSPLGQLPYAALRQDTSGAPRYLGVEHAISRQFTIGSMLQLEALELGAESANPLAMAPTFHNEQLQIADLREAGFFLSPLFYSKDEINQLAERSYGNYYLDGKATLSTYIKSAPEHNIIHLATHAISSQTDGLQSRIYFLDETGEPTSLYASEVGEQTLNADLVVLSACETSTGGQHAVEGTIGLHRAYLAAGARSVVASLWPVDDYATAALMNIFYDELANGLTPDKALQKARQIYLLDNPDATPYKWAAFEAYGGMKPVRWEREAPLWPKMLWGVAGLVVVGGFWTYKTVRHAA